MSDKVLRVIVLGSEVLCAILFKYLVVGYTDLVSFFTSNLTAFLFPLIVFGIVGEFIYNKINRARD